MKKILTILMMIFTSVYIFSLNGIIRSNQENSTIGQQTLRSVDELIEEGWTPISTFVDLARISRRLSDRTTGLANQPIFPAEDIPEYLEPFYVGPDSRFFLTNDIDLPYVGTLRMDIEEMHREDPSNEEYRLKYQLIKLIPDYFRHGDHNATTYANSRIRGWTPGLVPFEGIFDGRGHTVSGLAGDRHFAGVTASGNPNEGLADGGGRAIGGLFGIVKGTIKNLNVEIGQEISSASEGLFLNQQHRNAIMNFSFRGQNHNLNSNNDLPVWQRPSGFQIERHDGLIEADQGWRGGVGAITGILYHGNIINSSSSSRSSNNLLTNNQNRIGGLVGYAVNGTVVNSGSYAYISGIDGHNQHDPTNITMNNIEPLLLSTSLGSGGRNMGGLIGYARNTDIKNSYSKASMLFFGLQSGGLVGLINGGTIENSFSGTQFGIALDFGVPTITGPNIGAFIGRQNGTVPYITNSFTYTNAPVINIPGFPAFFDSMRPPFDGFLGSGSAHAENIFSVNLSGNASISQSLTRLSEEQMKNPLIVDNIINREESIFHIIPNEDGTPSFPTLNPEPTTIERVRVNAPDSMINYLEGLQVLSGEYIYLTPGEFTLTLTRIGETRDFTFVITPDDLLENAEPIVIWSILFRDQNNGIHDFAFFRSGDSLSTVEIPAPSVAFVGWFSSRGLDGVRIEYAPFEHLEVWARFRDLAIHGSLGQAGAGASIYLVSLIGHDEENRSLSADMNGEFHIPNISIGQFNLIVQLNGFISIQEFIDTFEHLENNDGDINLVLTLTQVSISGVAPANSTIIITNAAGSEVFNETTGFLGNFEILGLLDGQYFINITAPGFEAFSNSFLVERQHINLNELFGYEGTIVLHAVSISGTAITGTEVRLYLFGFLLGSIIVDESGEFIFAYNVNAIPIHNNPSYEIVARLETFNEIRKTVSVSSNVSEVVNFNQEPLAIRGLTSQGTTITLIRNNVVVETVQSNAFGEFEFLGVENGLFTLVFERRNFETIYLELDEINFVSIDIIERVLLQRIPSDNALVGVIVQGIIVAVVILGVWAILYKNEKKKASKKYID